MNTLNSLSKKFGAKHGEDHSDAMVAPTEPRGRQELDPNKSLLSDVRR
jgi:hypothetical protein